jgi:hypothetical protein
MAGLAGSLARVLSEAGKNGASFSHWGTVTACAVTGFIASALC